MTTKTFIATALMTFIGLTGFAQTTKNASVTAGIQMTQNRQIRIWFMDVQNEKITFSIVDSKGNMLNNRSYRCKGNAKILLETSDLSNGFYTVIARSNGMQLATEQIIVNNGQIQQFDKNDNYLVTK
jgi:hypothetical protein